MRTSQMQMLFVPNQPLQFPSSVSLAEGGNGLHTPCHCRCRGRHTGELSKVFCQEGLTHTHTHTLFKYSFSSTDLYFHKTDICISKEITSLSKESSLILLACFLPRPNLEHPATCLHHQAPAKQRKFSSDIHFPSWNRQGGDECGKPSCSQHDRAHTS